MALSGSVQSNFGGAAGDDLGLRIEWSATQNIVGNYSTVTAEIYLMSNKSWSAVYASANNEVTLNINGNTTSGWQNAGIGNNTSKWLLSHTVRVYHNADGAKNFSISGSFNLAITYAGAWIGTKYVSDSWTLNTIPRASSITTKNATTLAEINSADYGQTIRLSINRASSSFTSTVYAIWNDQIVGIAERIDYEQHNWEIPAWLMDHTPNSANSWGAIYCETFSGETLLGTTVTWLNAIVPPGVIPVINTSTVTEAVAGLAAQFGAFVQSKSKLALAMTASGVYSSTISAYKITANGSVYGAASATTAEVVNSGAQNVVFEVTDSRGRKASVIIPITAQPYTAPSITSFTAVRADETGAVDDEGTYAKVDYLATMSPVNGGNTKTLLVRYKKTNEETWSEAVVTNAAFDNLSGGALIPGFDIDYAYDVAFVLTDYFNTVSKEAIPPLPTGFTLVNYHPNGKAMAFGEVMNEESGMNYNLAPKFKKAPTILAPTSDTEDAVFLNLKRFDETILGILATGPGGQGLNLHIYDGVALSGTIKIGADGSLFTTGGLTVTGAIEANGIVSKEIPTSADLNNYQTPGLYHCLTNATAGTISNVAGAAAFSLFVERHAGIKQTFTRYETGNPATYIRNYYDGTWGAWHQVAFI